MVPQDAPFLKNKMTQNGNIKSLLYYSNQFYQELLGYKPKKTSLYKIPEFQWDSFVRKRALNSNSSGIYLPRNQTAIIKLNGKLTPLSLFHEYFGHGLYCEQSLQGRELVSLERRLLKEEKQKFQKRQFSSEEIRQFRQQNQTFQKLCNFLKEKLSAYEIFAIFTEFLLSREFNLRNDFERKYDSLAKQDKEAIANIISFNQQYGDLATFYNFGLSRITNPQIVNRLLKELYKDKIRDARFALLYGSRKEFSDIDVFAVSNNLQETDSLWLDVRVYSISEFEERIKMFDVAVTDPIFTGELLFGDEEYLKQKRGQLQEQLISDLAIKHNLKQSKKQKDLAFKFPINSRENIHGLDYSLTYSANALALSKGQRVFTKKDLILFSKRAPAEGDKPLQLGGG